MDIWAATKNYQKNKAGAVTLYLRDYNGSTWTEIGNASAYDPDWQGGSSDFVKASIIMVNASYTVSAGNELEVRLMADSEAGVASMWLAYDTTSNPTVLKDPLAALTAYSSCAMWPCGPMALWMDNWR